MNNPELEGVDGKVNHLMMNDKDKCSYEFDSGLKHPYLLGENRTSAELENDKGNVKGACEILEDPEVESLHQVSNIWKYM